MAFLTSEQKNALGPFLHIGIFLVAGGATSGNPVPLVLQGLVLVIAIGLISLARYAAARSWPS